MSPKSELETLRSVAVVAALTALFTLVPSPAAAQEIGEREPIENNSGPRISGRPGAHFPAKGNMGLAVDASATYGLPYSPVVVAPGGRFTGYFGDNGAVTGMPIVEVMLPISAIVPYAKAGVGVGHATGPNETSVAFMGGGGVDVHLTRDVLLGVDATYETVVGTGFSTVAIGPRAGLRY